MHYKTYFDSLTDSELIDQIVYLQERVNNSTNNDKRYIEIIISELYVYFKEVRRHLLQDKQIDNAIKVLLLSTRPRYDEEELFAPDQEEIRPVPERNDGGYRPFIRFEINNNQ